MIDLKPAATRVAQVLAAVDDDQLGAPTPCGTSSVGDVIDHIATLSAAFTAKAWKDIDGPGGSGRPPPPSAANLRAGWREDIAQRLRTLAAAWAEPSAWEGMTNAGGLDLPADVAGLVVLDELIIHGWDVAIATGVDYHVPEDEIQPATAFVSSFDAPRDGALFGPEVAVPDDAPAFERLLGLTGRDPAWKPST